MGDCKALDKKMDIIHKFIHSFQSQPEKSRNYLLLDIFVKIYGVSHWVQSSPFSRHVKSDRR
jgi:hypothetical protein